MEHGVIVENEFSYIENGEGRPIVILHGLMGGLSNFKGVYEYFPKKNYKIVMPELPIEKVSILNTNVKTFVTNCFTAFYKRLKKIINNVVKCGKKW